MWAQLYPPTLQREALWGHAARYGHASDQLAAFNFFLQQLAPVVFHKYLSIDVTQAPRGDGAPPRHHTLRVLDLQILPPTVPPIESGGGTLAGSAAAAASPPLSLTEARNRRLTYACTFTGTVQYVEWEGGVGGAEAAAAAPPATADDADAQALSPLPLPQDGARAVRSEIYHGVRLCSLPVMVGSLGCHRGLLPPSEAPTECTYDQGGYFLVRGHERVLQPQVALRNSRVIVKLSSGAKRGGGSGGGGGVEGAVVVDATCRSIRESKPLRSTSTLTARLKTQDAGAPDSALTVNVQYLAERVPVAAVFRTLDVDSLRDFEAVVWQGVPPNPASERLVQSLWAHPCATAPLESVLVDTLGADKLHDAEAKDRDAKRLGKRKRRTSTSTPAARAARAARLAAMMESRLTAGDGGRGGGDDDLLDAAAAQAERLEAVERRARVQRDVRGQLASELLPHLGCDGSPATRARKALYLGALVRRMVLVAAGEVGPDDVDDVANKSVFMFWGSKQLASVLRQRVQKCVSLAHKQLFSRVSNGEGVDVRGMLRTIDASLSAMLHKHFASGVMTVTKENPTSADGIMQIVPYINPLSMATLQRRILNRLNGHYVSGRAVYASQMGLLDPAITPEHDDTGALLDMALFAHVSPLVPRGLLADLLGDLWDWCVAVGGVLRRPDVGGDGDDGGDHNDAASRDALFVPFPPAADGASTRAAVAVYAQQVRAARALGGGIVSVNGDWVGTTLNGDALRRVARAARLRGYFPPTVSIVAADEDGSSVALWGDGGQLVVPLVNLEALRALCEYDGADAARAADADAVRALTWRGGVLDPRDAALADGTCGRPSCDACFGGAAPTAAERARCHAVLAAASAARVPPPPGAPSGGSGTVVNMAPSGAESPWALLSRAGVLEWLGAEEIGQTVRLAFLPQEVDACDARRAAALRDGTFLESPFTHLAPHPSAMYSLSTAIVPFANHDAAPRLTYAGNMARQAIGIPVTNLHGPQPHMGLAYAHQLCYPQRPLCSSDAIRAARLDEWPSSENAVFAITSWHGFNDEDAIVANEAAVQRGQRNVILYRTFYVRAAAKWEEIGHPLAAARDAKGAPLLPPPDGALPAPPKRHATLPPSAPTWEPPARGVRGAVNYDSIGLDGLPPLGAELRAGDVIVGVVGRSLEMDLHGRQYVQRTDRSVVVGRGTRETYRVDSVCVSTNTDGSRSVTVRVRAFRQHAEGDKAAFPHGQKGVVGAKVRAEDMPFTARGVIPELLINAQCISSRLTIGWLIEAAYSRLGVRAGQFQDATIFRNVRADWVLQRILEDARGGSSRSSSSRSSSSSSSSSSSGERGARHHPDALFAGGGGGGGADSLRETLYDGATGVPLTSDAFVGVGLLQTLKHYVEDKLNARARGPTNPQTMQPTSGVANEGAQKNGGMEYDALRAHGAAFLMDDRLAASGRYSIPVCRRCGRIAEEREPTLAALTRAALDAQRAAAAEDAGDGAAAATAAAQLDNPTVLCRLCGDGSAVVYIQSTYVYGRLLQAQLSMMGIGIRHVLQSDAEVAAEQRAARSRVLEAASVGATAAAAAAAEAGDDDDDDDEDELEAEDASRPPRRRARGGSVASEETGDGADTNDSDAASDVDGADDTSSEGGELETDEFL